MRFVMQVYKFEPDQPHGDPSCGAGDAKRRREGAAEPAGAEAATPPGS
jgi:hypothetical protein